MSSFFKASKKVEDVKSSQSNYINQSGFYDVEILAPIVNVSDNGSTAIDFYIDNDDQEQMLYGNLRITNNDGQPNKIGSKLFNQLLVIADLDEVDEPVELELPIGKNGTEKVVPVLEDLMNLQVIMRIQMEYSRWNGKIQERKVIRAFFRSEDKASAEEILTGENIGAAYEREQKYADNISYKDVTPEEVQEWIASGRGRNSSGNTSNTAKKKPTRPAFGKRKKKSDDE